MKNLGGHILALLAYLLLAIIFTWPLAANFTSAIPGGPGDGTQSLWNLWRFHFALKHGLPLFFTNELFVPSGADLFHHTYASFLGLLSFPLSFFLGYFAIYNTLVLAGITINGMALYALGRVLTPSAVSAFAGGALYAVCPFFFGHLLGHLHMVWGGIIPLFMLCMIMMFRDRRIRWAILCGALFFIQVSCGYKYAVFLILIFFIYIVFMCFQDMPGIYCKKSLINISVMVFTSLALCSYFITGYVESSLKNVFIDTSHLSAIHYIGSAMSDYVEPSGLNHIYTRLGLAAGRANISERNTFLGYSVITALIFSLLSRRIPSGKKSFWYVLFFIFMWLSLGGNPGQASSAASGGSFLYNYLSLFHYLHLLPLFDNIRTPASFNIVVCLSASVIFMYFFELAAGSGKKMTLLAFAVLCAALVEYYPGPYPIQTFPGASCIEMIKNDKSDCSVLNFPLVVADGIGGLGWDQQNLLMYFQTLHEKRIFGGYLSRVPDKTFDFYSKHPFFSIMLAVQRLERNLTVNGGEEESRELLNKYKLRYIIIDSRSLGETKTKNIVKILNKLFAVKAMSNTGGIICIGIKA